MAEVRKFGLRSLRSGAAGQALVNLMSQDGGVPQSHHYQSTACCLGHSSLTRVTIQTYIGPLGNLLLDDSAVLFGEEEEGVVGGHADVEVRVARLPEYKKFMAQEGAVNMDRGEDAPPLPWELPCKLRQEISSMADAEPDVVAAKRIALDASAAWRSAWLSERPLPNPTPGMCYDGEIEECFKHMKTAIKSHSRVRSNAVLLARKRSPASRKLKKLEGHLVLRLYSDMCSKTLHLLRDYHEKRETAGKMYFYLPTSFIFLYIFYESADADVCFIHVC